MSGLCGWISDFAVVFIGLALLVIAVGVVFPLFARKSDGQGQPRRMFAGIDVTSILEGLAKVLAALKDLPPWMAIFLAGLALVWTAATAPNLCT